MSEELNNFFEGLFHLGVLFFGFYVFRLPLRLDFFVFNDTQAVTLVVVMLYSGLVLVEKGLRWFVRKIDWSRFGVLSVENQSFEEGWEELSEEEDKDDGSDDEER